MVCRWPWGLVGTPVGRHFHYIAREYVFVNSAMGPQKEISERHNSLPMAICFVSFIYILLPFSHISACFVG